MNRLSAVLASLGALGACSVTATACAQSPTALYNPAGFYIGGAVGESDVHTGNDVFDNNYDYYRHHTAWKGMVGIRPIHMLGAELDYIDFGSPNNNAYYGYYYSPDAKAKAGAAFGVLYLPLPVPFFDVYGKAGVARLHNIDYLPQSYSCPALSGCYQTIQVSQWSTDFAYGGGVQWHWGGLGLRAEYERLDTSGPNPEVLTVGLTWTF